MPTVQDEVRKVKTEDEERSFFVRLSEIDTILVTVHLGSRKGATVTNTEKCIHFDTFNDARTFIREFYRVEFDAPEPAPLY